MRGVTRVYRPVLVSLATDPTRTDTVTQTRCSGGTQAVVVRILCVGSQDSYFIEESNMWFGTPVCRNHASVIFWSFCNEVGCSFPNKSAPTQPSLEFKTAVEDNDGTRAVTANMCEERQSLRVVNVSVCGWGAGVLVSPALLNWSGIAAIAVTASWRGRCIEMSTCPNLDQFIAGLNMSFELDVQGFSHVSNSDFEQFHAAYVETCPICVLVFTVRLQSASPWLVFAAGPRSPLWRPSAARV